MNDAHIATGTPTRRGEETRARILAVAQELIHRQGFKNTGLQDILAASGVPKGSFYFYFRSKEELGRELLVRYRQSFREEVAATLFHDDSEVVPQILAFFRDSARRQVESGCRSGCLLGNLAAEVTDVHEDLRREIATALLELRQVFAEGIARGQRRGELRTDFAPVHAAEFLIAVLEGSILVAKARRDPAAFTAIEAMIERHLDALRSGPGRPHGAVKGGHES